MTDWIRFEDREPTGWFVAADCDGVSIRPFCEREVVVARDECGFTHWKPFEPPADLPPKPLPVLPDGWEWHYYPEPRPWHVAIGAVALFDGKRISIGGGQHVPIAVIDALLEVAGVRRQALYATELTLSATLRERIEEARAERDAAADEGDYEAAALWRTRVDVYEEILGEVER